MINFTTTRFVNLASHQKNYLLGTLMFSGSCCAGYKVYKNLEKDTEPNQSIRTQLWDHRKQIIKSSAVVGLASLGVYKIWRKNQLWNEILSTSQNLDKVRNANCALFLYSEDLYNEVHAYTTQKYITETQRIIFHWVHPFFHKRSSIRIRNKGFVPIIKKIGRVQEMDDCIEQLHKQNNRIKLLIIHAHGNPSSICINKECLYPRDIRMIRMMGKMDIQSCVILDSCSTGKEENGTSFAQQISKPNPKICVIAPTKDITIGTHYHFKTNKQMMIDPKVTFRNLEKSMKGENVPFSVFQDGRCIMQQPPKKPD